jgi:hypothetical protein
LGAINHDGGEIIAQRCSPNVVVYQGEQLFQDCLGGFAMSHACQTV